MDARAVSTAWGLGVAAVASGPGAVVAHAFAEGLYRTGPDLDGFLDAMEAAKDFDLGLCVAHALGRDERQFGHDVGPTVLRQRCGQPLDGRSLRAPGRRRLVAAASAGGTQ